MRNEKQYVVALKVKGKVNPFCYGGYTYIKARPVDDQMVIDMTANCKVLQTPVEGDRYFNCHLLTSPVVSFKSFKNGWEVQTENSLYQFFVTDMDEIKRLAGENKFSGPGKLNDVSESLYWS